MPVIKIWNIPNDRPECFRNMADRVVSTICSTEELGLKEGDVTILFPETKIFCKDSLEIIIEITGLFKKPERTPIVLRQVAAELGIVVSECFPKEKVECFVSPFEEAVNGFWSSDEA